jgi:enoyl-CoA hydratase
MSAPGDDAPHVAPRVLTQERGTVAVIRLDRPAERNPLSTETLDELERAFTRLSSRTDLQALVFTGSRDVFASGANIRELCELTPDAARRFSERGQRLFQSIADAPLLTVAAVNGFCMGGGLDLALSCDMRVASPSAVFGHPGARLGIITGWGGTQRLPRVVGAARAFEMFLTARRVSAAEALEMGLVRHIFDPVLESAVGMAAGLRK